jgi:hypothetical protein
VRKLCLGFCLLLILLAVLPAAVAAAAGNLSVATGPAQNVTAASATLGGNVQITGAALTRAWFEYGLNTSYGYTTGQQPFNTSSAFSATVGSLQPGTTYHFRAAAMSAVAGAPPVYGNDVTFVTQKLPPPPPPPPPPEPVKVTTLPASGLGQTSASLMGNLVSAGSGNSIVACYFEWGDTGVYGKTTPQQGRTGPGGFSAPLGGLVPGTLYHFRAVAAPGTPGAALVLGEDQTFRTASPAALQVSTYAASAISASGAVLNGGLSSLGGLAKADVYFQWGSTTAYGTNTPSQSRTGTGAFSAPVGGLGPGTYHFRAVAAAGGTASPVYGQDMSFTISPAPTLQVYTAGAGNVSATSASLNGSLVALGGYPSVSVSFDWGTTTGYGSSTPGQAYGGPGDFNAPLSGLASGVTYHFRAVARPGAAGAPIYYGADRTFNTQSAPFLQVITEPATGVSASSAVLNGDVVNPGPFGQVTCWFQWGVTPAYGQSTPLQTQVGAFTFNASLGGLSQGQTYHYRAVAQGISGASPVFGMDRAFTTGAVPGLAVATTGVDSVTPSSAILYGDILSAGSYPLVESWFEWGTSGYGNSTPRQSYGGPFDYSSALTGLSPSSTYFFRAAARGSLAGSPTVYGAPRSFSTPAQPAITVYTEPATDIRTGSATLNGELASIGPYAQVQVSFEWGSTTSYGNVMTYQAAGSSVDFSQPLTGLANNLTYHYRAVARAGDYMVYGGDVVFTTSASPPPPAYIQTEPASDVSGGRATLNGELVTLGAYPRLTIWFEWGVSTSYGNATNRNERVSPIEHGAQLNNLLPGTTYHFRAVAAVDPVRGPYFYGADVSFTTPGVVPPSPPPVPPTNLPRVAAGGATSISPGGATLTGDLASLGGAGSVQVFFEWGDSSGYGETTPVLIKTAAGAFNAALTDLEPGRIYHYRAVAIPQSGDGMPVFSPDMAFSTPLERRGCG